MKPSLNYYQAVEVGKVKTDVVQFTTIQAAVDAITDNAAGKRYAIYVHPGIYTEKVITEDYIDLIAVGGREETVINFVSTVANEATVTGENCQVKGFTITTDSTNFIGRCIQNATAGFELEDCILSVAAPTGNELVFNTTQACAIRDCQIDTAGAGAAGLTLAGAAVVTVDGTTINSATDAVQVTAAGTITLTDCTVNNLIDQDAGTINIVRSKIEEVALGTAACTLSADLTTFSSTFATADAFAHTITCKKCSFAGQNVNNAATGATTINLRDCDGIATLTNAGVGGTLNLWDCGVETLTTTQGTVVAYGGRIAACGGSTGTSFVWWINSNELMVEAGMKIADALAASAAGDVIKLGPSTYAESNLTLKAGVNLIGTDPDQCLISTGDAANAILNAGVTCTISNITVTNTNAGHPAIEVTANVLTVRNCIIAGTGAGDAIAMIAGTLNAYDTSIGAGDIDLSTAICTLSMYRCRITTDPVDTAGAFAHVLTFEHCDFGGQSIVSIASGATTLEMRHCSNGNGVLNSGGGTFNIYDTYLSGTVTNNLTGTINLHMCKANAATQAATAGTIYGYSSYMGTLTTGATGTIWLTGDCYITDIAANAGVIKWEVDTKRWRVMSGTANMKIADALTAASSGDLIEILPGTYAESNLTAKNGVNIVGEGFGLSIIEATDNANPIVAVGNSITCEIHGVKVSNLGTGGAIHIEPVAANSTLALEDCWVTNAGAGDAVVASIGGAGLATVNARRCDLGGNAAASIVKLTRAAGAGTLAFNSWDCAFTTSGGAAKAAIEASAAVVADVNVYRATFSGCTLALYSTGANHTVDIEDSEFGSCGVELAANVPVVNLTKCNSIGTFTHSTASTVTLLGCNVTGTYTTAGVAAIVTASGCGFTGAITHAGSGAFSLKSCLTAAITNSSTATMTIVESDIGAVAQGAAAGTINITNSGMTTITTGATGTIQLNGGCNFTDISANAGVLTWKIDPNHLKVVAGTANMKVADALTLAAAGDVIQVMPGTYAESNLTLKAGVNLVGTDPDQCVIQKSDGAQAILNAAVTCSISNLKVTNDNAAQPAIKVTANVLTVRNCVVAGNGAGDAIAMIAGTLNAYDTTVSTGDIDLSTAICTLSMYRCRITTDPIDTAGAFAHVLVIENTDFGGQPLVSAATGATTLAMRGCTNGGTVSNLGTGTFAIQDSDLVGVTANNALAIIRLKNCHYRIITRTLGAIVDESPEMKDTIFHVLDINWDALIANANLATRVAVAGAVTSGGSGQARLRINDNAADAAGVENNADAAGALDSSWTPARAPRHCMQISVGAFRATTTMFFGLRATPGAAVPAAAEDHAGFIWTGAAFNASSSDGGGVGEVTALATPSTGAQHQFEIIIIAGVRVEFYVDGVLVATNTDVGIPDAALDYQEYEISTGGGGATTSDITLRKSFLQECPA